MHFVVAALVLLSPVAGRASSNDDLYKAIISNNLAAVKQAIAAGADVNKPDPNGNQPLATAVWNPEIVTALLGAKADAGRLNPTGAMNGVMAAAAWGEPEAIKLMIAAGADPNARNKDGYTALHFASFMSSSLPAIAALVTGGADLNAKTSIGLTPFHLVLKEARTPADRVKQLKTMAPWIEKTGVVLPERVRDPKESQFSTIGEMIGFFVDKGIDINAPITFQITDKELNEMRVQMAGKFTGAAAQHFETALAKMKGTKIVTYAILLAAEKGKVDAMMVLAEKGARLDVKSTTGSSPFWYAAYGGNLDAYQLIKGKLAKPDVNEADAMGVTVLMAAAMGGNAAIIHDLLAGGANLEATERFGGTALHYAASYNRPEAVQALIEHHAKLDTARKTIEGMDKEGWSTHTVYGATSYSRTTTTYKQTTPLGIAKVNAQNPRMGSYDKVIEILEKAGAKALQ